MPTSMRGACGASTGSFNGSSNDKANARAKEFATFRAKGRSAVNLRPRSRSRCSSSPGSPSSRRTREPARHRYPRTRRAKGNKPRNDEPPRLLVRPESAGLKPTRSFSSP
jgi:hypothetical protein